MIVSSFEIKPTTAYRKTCNKLVVVVVVVVVVVSSQTEHTSAGLGSRSSWII